jgi:glyoxylase-like metal-dependent hydrolase (beta-lactamase superfamily II)
VEYRIISIGTLPAHPLWGERSDVRTGHCTTVLVVAGTARIIVDPSLPEQALAARLFERTPIRLEDVTHVFLTNFQPDHRRALTLFARAEWLLAEPERESARATLDRRRREAEEGGDIDTVDLYRRELECLERFRSAPDQIAPGVDLFPLPGVTAGHCGLLLALPALTVLIAGDAVATIEHLEQGKVLSGCVDVEQAQDSFREVVEIADVIVPGRDNLIMNPLRRLMG